jgi:DNA polymerase-3 subunit alpha
LDFELLTISNSGYPGYFDCTGFNCRSQKYSSGRSRSGSGGIGGGVLFENYEYRPIDVQPAFALPESDRVSPDIDIDFDDEGRSSVMDYVIRNMVETSGTNYHLW